jgi:hypothetical protein
MSRAAYNEFLEVQDLLANLPPVGPLSHDSWHFIWEQHKYAASK